VISRPMRCVEEPNQALEPTRPVGTSAAEQPRVPTGGVAHYNVRRFTASRAKRSTKDRVMNIVIERSGFAWRQPGTARRGSRQRIRTGFLTLIGLRHVGQLSVKKK